MALFRISKGLKANLPSQKTEGYCWYTTDDSLFYIDYVDNNGVLQRKALNAQEAETLAGASLSTILESSDIEIPTSKAVLDALDNKANLENGQYTVTTTGSGTAYVAEVPGITALTVGASFIMVPHTVSTSTAPTLNVNNLGEKAIKRRLSSIVTAVQAGYSASWLAANKPFRVVYDGTQWIVDGHDKPVGADVYGAVAKATGDENGNNIADTYATKTELQALYPKVSSVTISSSSWSGTSSPYSQGVTISGTTANSKIDFQPTAVQVTELQNAGVQLMVENNSGACTVWALGNKPASDMTITVLLTETVQI